MLVNKSFDGLWMVSPVLYASKNWILFIWNCNLAWYGQWRGDFSTSQGKIPVIVQNSRWKKHHNTTAACFVQYNFSEDYTTNCLTFFWFLTFSNIAAIIDNMSGFCTSNYYNSIKVGTSIDLNVFKSGWCLYWIE